MLDQFEILLVLFAITVSWPCYFLPKIIKKSGLVEYSKRSAEIAETRYWVFLSNRVLDGESSITFSLYVFYIVYLFLRVLHVSDICMLQDDFVVFDQGNTTNISFDPYAVVEPDSTALRSLAVAEPENCRIHSAPTTPITPTSSGEPTKKEVAVWNQLDNLYPQRISLEEAEERLRKQVQRRNAARVAAAPLMNLETAAAQAPVSLPPAASIAEEGREVLENPSLKQL